MFAKNFDFDRLFFTTYLLHVGDGPVVESLTLEDLGVRGN